VGYHEIMGVRQRYRLVDLERLCWRLGQGSLEEVQKNLQAALEEKIAQGQARREAHWTESLAVGSAAFVTRIQPLILTRQETETRELSGGTWVLEEEPVPYGRF
jgi:putative transposase